MVGLRDGLWPTPAGRALEPNEQPSASASSVSSQPGARPLRRHGLGGGLARAAPAALPPLDELPHRALFALANAGIAIDGGFLARAFTSPITLGILFGYVIGKPVGILGGSWLLTRLSRGRLRPPVGWVAVAGGGTIAGIGSSRAACRHTCVRGTAARGKLGILSAAFGAALLTWLLFRATALLPRRLRIRALLGTAEPLADLYIEVDPERDHIRGPIDASVTVVEYGDFQCPYRAGGAGRARAPA